MKKMTGTGVSDSKGGYIFSDANKDRFRITSKSLVSHLHRKIMLKIVRFYEFAGDKNNKILDVGCGYGTSLVNFASEGYKRLYGVEPDEALIKHIPQGIAEVKIGVAQSIPYPDAYFDVVFVNGALHHVPPSENSYQTTCDELDRVLKPGGYVFFMEPGHYWMNIFCELGANILGVVSKTFRAWADVIYDERAELHYFIKKHGIFRDGLAAKNYEVIHDGYFVFSWIFSARKKP